MTPIIDSHLDLSWNALSWNRDQRLPLAELRRREAGIDDDDARGHATVSLPEMRRGGVMLCLATMLARAKSPVDPRKPVNLNFPSYWRINLDFAGQDIACAMAGGQLRYYRVLEGHGELRAIRNRTELEAHWREVEQSAGAGWQGVPIGYILAMEGADPIIAPAEAEGWFGQGLRVAGLAHYGPSAYAVGTGDRGPLTAAGKELLNEFERLGMILDLTHSSDPSFFQALELFGGAVLASHNNCRAIVPGERQYSDEQIKLLIQRGGVIGVVCDAWMLYPAGWKRGVTERSVVSMEALADQVDHICQLAGNSAHAAIGSDLDGGFGAEQCPMGLDSIADLQKLEGILSNRGYAKADIEGVFHGNWLRFFREHLPA